MPTVCLAPSVARWLSAHPTTGNAPLRVAVPGQTVRAALQAVFQLHPQLQSYIVDEHFHVRHHVVVYVRNEAITDKAELLVPLGADTEVHIFQALSGG